MHNEKGVFPEHRALLEKVMALWAEKTPFSLYCGVELEFYLSKTTDISLFSSLLSSVLPTLSPLEHEKGDGQYECCLLPSKDPIQLADDIVNAKSLIASTAQRCGGEALLAAKPWDHQPGNGMHIHISLKDSHGVALFQKIGQEESPLLCYAVEGLLSTLPVAMRYFAPYPESYKRFVPSPHHDTATTISWGGNNRSTAIRIPDSSADPTNRHIEHRIPGMDANPYAVLAAIITGLYKGITEQRVPSHPKIYGNASDPQYKAPPYHLTSLPSSLTEALACPASLYKPFM